MSTEADTRNAERKVSLGILDDLATVLDTGYIEDTFEIAGHFWRMRTLCDHETNWAAQFTLTGTGISMVMSNRAPTLAMAIRAIGKTREEMRDVGEIFLDAYREANGGISAQVAAMLSQSNPYAKQYFFAEKLYEWLSKRPPSLVRDLHEAYLKMERRNNEAGDAMGKSSEAAGK